MNVRVRGRARDALRCLGLSIPSLLAWGFVACSRPAQHPQASAVSACLDGLAQSRGAWNQFSVTYDDVHGLYGGIKLTVKGDGKVEQSALRANLGEAKDVTPAELARVLEVIRSSRAWEQLSAPRDGVPDEGILHLTLRCGGVESSVWHWQEELTPASPISRVRDVMKSVAWK